MTYNGNDILDIKYPELNKNFDLRVDPILYKQIHGTEENAEKHSKINDIFSFHTLWHIVNDFNGDAVEDLCRVSIPYKTPIDYCYEYIYYEYEKGELKPVQAIYAPTYGEDKKNALLVYIYSLINSDGYFSIEENGIVNQEMQLNYEYTYDEITETLEELKKEKILTIKGDRAYINF